MATSGVCGLLLWHGDCERLRNFCGFAATDVRWAEVWSVCGRLDREFEEFVHARSGSLLRTAMLLVGDAGQAQDILQVALWRTSRRWAQAADQPDAYVRKVLVNLAHDGRRHASRRVAESPLDDSSPGSVADRAASVVERHALVAALRLLPARQCATLVLRFWDDLSVEETASALAHRRRETRSRFRCAHAEQSPKGDTAWSCGTA